MGIYRLSFDSEKAAKYLHLFQQGRSEGLDYIYHKSFRHFIHFGKELLNDEFTISTILQECYLKAWNQRNRMESLNHIYRFIRMNLRWQILRHIEKSRNSIYGQTLCLDQFENTIGDFEDLVENMESWQEHTQKLKTVTQTIQYLSPEAQQIVSLYFQKGLTHKQIADQLGKTTFQISSQIQKSVKQIKSMIHLSIKKIELNDAIVGKDTHTPNLDCQQSKIYDLRKNQKLSFEAIAMQLGLSTLQTKQGYITAHQLLQNQSRPKASGRF